MKAIMASLIVAATLLAAGPAQAWYCRAEGSTGAWGWGRSYSLRTAQRIALYQCAIRTPRGERCVISYCR